jgi:hypothetical protein
LIAKYGPVLHGELHVDLESGDITGDRTMLAFWAGVVESKRQRIADLEAALRECHKALTEAIGWIADTEAPYNGWNLNGPADRALGEAAIVRIGALLAHPQEPK